MPIGFLIESLGADRIGFRRRLFRQQGGCLTREPNFARFFKVESFNIFCLTVTALVLNVI